MAEPAPPKNSDQDSGKKPSPTPSKMTEIGAWVAVLVVIAWLILLFVLLNRVDAKDGEWTRLYTLLTSLETVAFAAAGALFGTTIQQRRVQDAKDETKHAKDEAKDARKDAAGNAEAATKGKALAEALKATAPSTEVLGVGLTEDIAFAHGTGRIASSDDLDRLRRLAVKLFPD